MVVMDTERMDSDTDFFTPQLLLAEQFQNPLGPLIPSKHTKISLCFQRRVPFFV